MENNIQKQLEEEVYQLHYESCMYVHGMSKEESQKEAQAQVNSLHEEPTEQERQEAYEEAQADLIELHVELNKRNGMSVEQAYEKARKDVAKLVEEQAEADKKLASDQTTQSPEQKLAEQREMLNEIRDLRRRNPVCFAPSFPIDSSIDSKIDWIQQQFKKDLSQVPNDVSADEISIIYNKYTRPLLKERFGIAEQYIAIISKLDNILTSHQLACKQIDAGNNELPDNLLSPDISSRELFLELRRIKKENKAMSKLSLIKFLLFIIALLTIGFASWALR